jgi:hypothetical protein
MTLGHVLEQKRPQVNLRLRLTRVPLLRYFTAKLGDTVSFDLIRIASH